MSYLRRKIIKLIEVPIYNDDGSVKITQEISPSEAQTLLAFALNFLVSTGLAANIGISVEDQENAYENVLEDFEPGEPND